jgi:GNAT superfamily N-acetyltransferase
MESSLTIRFFSPEDRASVRKISYTTAFAEHPHDYVDDEEAVADALTLYFTDYEPESCFVAVNGEQVVGYLIGTRNEPAMNKILEKHIYPGLAIKCLTSPYLWRKNSWRFIWGCLIGCLKGEIRRLDFTKEYPAVLHINILKDFRKSGVGRQLMESYLQYLRGHKITGVHCATLTNDAKEFFQKCGFQLLTQEKRFYGREGYCYILGKKL